jgi:hypothetical protein
MMSFPIVPVTTPSFQGTGLNLSLVPAERWGYSQFRTPLCEDGYAILVSINPRRFFFPIDWRMKMNPCFYCEFHRDRATPGDRFFFCTGIKDNVSHECPTADPPKDKKQTANVHATNSNQ